MYLRNKPLKLQTFKVRTICLNQGTPTWSQNVWQALQIWKQTIILTNPYSRVQFPRNWNILLLRINTPRIYSYIAISYMKMINSATDGDTISRFPVLSCVEYCNDYNLASCCQILWDLQCCIWSMKRLNQTESPVFVILCVLCFQRQSFLTFIPLAISFCHTLKSDAQPTNIYKIKP